MYSFLNLEPVHFSMFGSNYCLLTCIQIFQEAGKVVWNSHLFKNFPQYVVIHTVKGFSTVNEAEIDVFFWNSLTFSMIQQMLAIWSLIPSPFLNLACTSGSMWNECNCVVVWTFFGIAFLWDWNENLTFPGLWPLLSFPYVLPYWVQHFNNIFF